MTTLALVLLALSAAPQSITAETLDRVVAEVPDGYETERPFELAGGGEGRQPLPFAFSPGGERVVYFAYRKRRTHVMLGDEAGPWGDLFRAPVFSADGAHVAYAVGKQAKNRTAAWKVFVDETVVSKEDWVGPLTLSSDGKTIAYWSQPGFRLSRDGFSTGTRGELVIARARKKRFKAVRSDEYDLADTERAPELADKETRAIGRANVEGAPAVLSVGGRKDEIVWSEEGGFQDLVVSAAGDRFAFVHWDYLRDPDDQDWRAFIVEVDGAPIDVEADGVGLPAFSPNGEHLAFVYHAKARFGVGLHHERSDTLMARDESPITRVEVDDAGVHLAWIVHEKGKMNPTYRVIRHSALFVEGGSMRVASATVGSEDPPQLGPVVKTVGQIAFSPGGTKVAYVADNRVHCGEHSAGPFDALGSLHWLDESTIAFGTREGRTFWWRHLLVPAD